MELGFEVDIKLEDEGDWFTPDQLLGGRVKVRSKFTNDWKSAYRTMVVQAQRKKIVARAKFLEDGLRTMLADHCLVDWELKDKEENEVLYSKELAKKFMLEPKYRLFQDAVDWASDECGKAYEERDQEDETNFEEPSDSV